MKKLFVLVIATLLLASLVSAVEVMEIGDKLVFTDEDRPLAFILPPATSEASCKAREGTCYTDSSALGDRMVTACSFDNAFDRCVCDIELSSVCEGGSVGTGTGLLSCTSGTARCNGVYAQTCVNGVWVNQQTCSGSSVCERTNPDVSACFDEGDVVARDPAGEGTPDSPISVGVVSCENEGVQECSTVSIQGSSFYAPHICSDGILRNFGTYCNPDNSVCGVEDGQAKCFEKDDDIIPKGIIETVTLKACDPSSDCYQPLTTSTSSLINIIGGLFIVGGLVLSLITKNLTWLFLALAGIGIILFGGRIL